MADININVKLNYSGTALTSSNASNVKLIIDGVAYDASYTASAWRVVLNTTKQNLLHAYFPIRAEGLFGTIKFDSEELSIKKPTAHVNLSAGVGFSTPTAGLENPRFIDFPEPKPFPVAENVPEAAGEAPTAAEFKALLDALIDAGLMKEASAEE